MANFNLYSAADIGLSDSFANFFTSATSTVAASISPDALEMTDNDLLFEDEGAASDQTLTADLYLDGNLVGSIGGSVINLGQSTVTNATTGEVGLLIVVQVDGVALGYATTIDLNPGDSLTMTPWIGTQKSIDYDELEPSCFTRGTLIKTQMGDTAIEDLVIGDQVRTRDHGFQKIRWIGRQTCKAQGRMAPVLFKKGAIGNSVDLRVSPMHRILINGWRAELLFGQSELLAHAADLVNDSNIIRQSQPVIEYFHIMFDRHEIINSNGCLTESFHPEAADLRGFDIKTQQELFDIFPELASVGTYGPTARATLVATESMLLQSMF